MAVITISRQFGSSGTHIAKALADKLNFQIIDKELLESTLVEKYGIPEENVEKYDEKKPAFWDIFSSDKDRYLHFMKTAMYEEARKRDSIMLGRGGQVLFKDVPGVLHVRIIAPCGQRTAALMQEHGYDEKLAQQMMRHSDHDRAGFHKFFFHINWEDPCFYDLVINTSTFLVDAAVQLITTTLELANIKEKAAAMESKLADLCLAQAVVTQIAYKEHIPIQFLEAIVTNGIVTLKGSTITTEDIKRCETAAREVAGVKDVKNEVYFIPNTYGMS